MTASEQNMQQDFIYFLIVWAENHSTQTIQLENRKTSAKLELKVG